MFVAVSDVLQADVILRDKREGPSADQDDLYECRDSLGPGGEHVDAAPVVGIPSPSVVDVRCSDRERSCRGGR